MDKQNKQHQGRMICAWCGKDLGTSGTPEDSHGICKKCEKKFLQEYRDSRKRR